jgi:hypothetical protein
MSSTSRPVTPVTSAFTPHNPLPPTPVTPVIIRAREGTPTTALLAPFDQPTSHSDSDTNDGAIRELDEHFRALSTTQTNAVRHKPKRRELERQISLLQYHNSQLEATNEILVQELRELKKEYADETRRMQDVQWSLAVRVNELESRLLTAAGDMRQARTQFDRYEAVIERFGTEFITSLTSSLPYHSPGRLTRVPLNGPPTDRGEIPNIVASALPTNDHSAEMDDTDVSSRMPAVEGELINLDGGDLEDANFWLCYRDNAICHS